jgi:hypothetical protein
VFAEIGPVEIEPVEIGPAEIGPVEIGPVEIGPAEIEPVEIGPVEIGPVEIEINMHLKIGTIFRLQTALHNHLFDKFSGYMALVLLLIYYFS